MSKTFFEKLSERLIEIVQLDRQLTGADEMLDKNIDSMPERYARYIRASLDLTNMLRHDHKLVEAMAAINKEQRESRADLSNDIANIAHQILPENAEILIATSSDTLARVLAICVREDNLLADAYAKMGARERLELKRVISKL